MKNQAQGILAEYHLKQNKSVHLKSAFFYNNYLVIHYFKYLLTQIIKLFI